MCLCLHIYFLCIIYVFIFYMKNISWSYLLLLQKGTGTLYTLCKGIDVFRVYIGVFCSIGYYSS